MSTTLTPLACSQCGQEAPTDLPELTHWAYGSIAAQGEFPDVIDRLLLCPQCVEEEREHEFDEGGAD